jgi:hypothetical protein
MVQLLGYDRSSKARAAQAKFEINLAERMAKDGYEKSDKEFYQNLNSRWI